MSTPTLKGSSPVSESKNLESALEQLRLQRSNAVTPTVLNAETFQMLWDAADALSKDRTAYTAELTQREQDVVAERADDAEVLATRDRATEGLIEAMNQTRLRMRHTLGAEVLSTYGLAQPPSRLSGTALHAYGLNVIELLSRLPFDEKDVFEQTLRSELFVAYLTPYLDALGKALEDVKREREELAVALKVRDAAVVRLRRMNRATRLMLQSIEILIDEPEQTLSTTE